MKTEIEKNGMTSTQGTFAVSKIPEIETTSFN